VVPVVLVDIVKPRLYPRPLFPAAYRYGMAWIKLEDRAFRIWWWRLSRRPDRPWRPPSR
jgi:hypothetical protein